VNGPLLDLSRRVPGARAFLGIHPWHVQGSPGDSPGQLILGQLREKLLSLSSAALGETGLDRSRKDGQDKARYYWCLAQVRLARELRRPVAFHVVRAWGDFWKLLEEWKPGDLPFMIHSYTGSAEFQKQLSRKYNVWYSYSPFVLDSGSSRIRESLLSVPRDRLLLETDYPSLQDLDQNPARGSFDSLAPHYGRVAALLSLTREDLEGQVLANGLRFFRD